MEVFKPSLEMSEFVYYPFDHHNVLKHVVYSTDTEFGIIALILTDNKAGIKEMGPNVQARIREFLQKQDCRPVIIQTCLPGDNFTPLENDPQAVVMPHECYLNMLNFFNRDWARISSKIAADCKDMASGSEMVPISPTLFFRGQGIVNYRCELGPMGKNTLYLIVQGNSKNNFIEIFFQLNLKINIDGLMMSPVPLMLLAKDYESLHNILNYKAQKNCLALC